MMTEEVFETVKKIWPELMRMLQEKHPELLPLYRMRYEYATGLYPDAMRLHNARQLLQTYEILKKGGLL